MMATDPATLELRLTANIAALEKALARAEARAQAAANGIVMPFRQANKKVSDSMAASAASIAKGFELTGNQRFIIRDVTAQITDMATELSGGISVFKVIGQQVPQLLGPMGVFGAILGTVVAIAAPLVGTLVNMGGASDTLKPKVDAMAKAFQELEQAQKSATTSSVNMLSTYGQFATSAHQVLTVLRDMAKLDAQKAILATGDQIGKSFGNFVIPPSATPNDRGSGAFGKPFFDPAAATDYASAVAKIAEQFKVLPEEAAQFAHELKDVQSATTVRAMVDAADKARQHLLELSGGLGKMDDQTRAMYSALSDVELKAEQLQAMDLSAPFSAAAAAAQRMAEAVQSALSSADALAKSSGFELAMAKIDAQYGKDKVGAAAAKAGLTFDQMVQGSGAQFVNHDDRDQLAADRAAYIASQTEKARLEMEAQARIKASSGASSYAKGTDSVFAKADNEIAAAQLHIDMIGKTASQAAVLQARYDLLAQARKKNLDLDKVDVTTGQTLRQEIEARAQSIGELTAQSDQYTQRAQFMAQEQQNLQSGFIDAIVAGKSFSDVLRQLAQDFEKAILQATLFDSGPFGSGNSNSGGGLFGSLLKAIGFKASGGPVTAGMPYIVGEKRPELFIPNQSGTILPSVPSMIQPGSIPSIGAGGGGAMTVHVIVDTSEDLTAKATLSGATAGAHAAKVTVTKAFAAAARQQKLS